MRKPLVFPAHAGMNRLLLLRRRLNKRVPRPRGDEPKNWMLLTLLR